MREINAVQGSQEWKSARAKCFTASEAPVIMGASKYKKRSELLREKATGIEPEIDAVTQARFDAGHAAEAAARPLAEAIIGEELYPITATTDDGKYLASSDGATMLYDIGFEHKIFNAQLAESVKACIVPDSHKWQLVHQAMVFGFERIMFCVSDGTADNFHYCWFSATDEDIDRLIAGWKQFDEDLKNYQHVEPEKKLDGVAPDTLPALRVEVTGMVTASNLEQFKAAALSVFRGINTSLKTDQDFADAEKAVKFCKDAEEKLEAAKAHALSQTASIDDLFKTVDAIKEEARTVRLTLDKLVARRKEEIKLEVIQSARSKLEDHISKLNERIGLDCMPHMDGDFVAATKNKRSIASLRDAVDTELARCKIASNEVADRVSNNLAWFRKFANGFEFLFPDLAKIIVIE